MKKMLCSGAWLQIKYVRYHPKYWDKKNGWLCWGLMSQSTIFQSCRDGAIASWVINQYFRGVKCLAQGHNMAAVGFEPRTSHSGVRHSTTEPPRSPTKRMSVENLSLMHCSSGTVVFLFCFFIWVLWPIKIISLILSRINHKHGAKIGDPWEKPPDHLQAELGQSHMWSEQGSNSEWWDNKQFRVLYISSLNHSAMVVL